MSDTARDYQTIDATSTEGLEILFDVEQVTGAEASGAHVGEPVTGASASGPGVPVELAAKQMGTSTNALKKRLRKGTLSGYKVETKHGEKWFVDQNAVNVLAPVPVDLAQVPLDFSAQVLPGVEPVTCAVEPVPTTSEPSELLDKIRELENKLEGATYRNGYLEAENEGLKALIGAKETHIKLLTDSQHKTGWWSRFSSWFFKSR